MNGTVYNEKLKQAYTKANYISKGKYKRVEIAQRRDWLLFQVVV